MKLLLSILALASVASVQAIGVAFTAENYGGGDNVLSGPVEGPALTVIGELNSGGPLVDFDSNNGAMLLYESGGQASLVVDTGTLQDVTIHFDNPLYVFGVMGLSLKAEDAGDVVFTAVTNTGTYSSGPMAYPRKADEHFKIEALTGTVISSVRVQTTTELDHIRQVRFGAVEAVPEPASLLAMGLGVAAALRRRRA
jgi:hypothetical protein